MEKRKRYSGRQLIIGAITILVISVIAIFGMFYKLYELSRRNIISVWESTTGQMARDVKFYLTMPMDAVAFSAVTLNNMLREGASHEEAGVYLINETNIYSSIISENNTGVYAYYDGEYLDGSGWICPDDYVPTERPWYVSAIEGDGEITLVKPYMNLQTFTLMMSVSQMLDDGKSVVSMDIFLDNVQRMTEEFAENKSVECAFVVDKSGLVVAHSDKSMVGKNFEINGEFGESLLEDIRNDNMEYYVVYGDKYVVISRSINDDWVTGIIIDRTTAFGSLKFIYVLFGFVLTAVLIIMLVITIYINNKGRESYELSREVRAVADIYIAMIRADLKTDKMSVIIENSKLDALWESFGDKLSEEIPNIVDRTCSKLSKDIMLKFFDLSTLDDRMRDVNSISQEFLSIENEWLRARFVDVERDSDGHLTKALIAIESIDEDRKQQEKLRVLSETDLMTGILNRGSGENAVRANILEGKKGMFCLIDADNFKAINDNFGHDVGDKVIIGIANCLERACRESDIVFRLGGDEFAIFVKNIDSEEVGNIILSRFFRFLQELNIPELKGRTISVSIGAAISREDEADSFESLYKRADVAAYESKSFRNNHITFN